MSMRILAGLGGAALAVMGFLVGGCATKGLPEEIAAAGPADFTYVIAPGDTISIFVWGNPEISQSATVRPDGKISAPLVEEVEASGKTPPELARDVEKILSQYVRDPLVTIMVGGFVGRYEQQVRVLGEAASPQAIPFREDMTLLDLMIAVGGLTEFAAGNKAVLIRNFEGKQEKARVRLDDLIQDGDITANIALRPGDILIIPEAWF